MKVNKKLEKTAPELGRGGGVTPKSRTLERFGLFIVALAFLATAALCDKPIGTSSGANGLDAQVDVNDANNPSGGGNNQPTTPSVNPDPYARIEGYYRADLSNYTGFATKCSTFRLSSSKDFEKRDVPYGTGPLPQPTTGTFVINGTDVAITTVGSVSAWDFTWDEKASKLQDKSLTAAYRDYYLDKSLSAFPSC